MGLGFAFDFSGTVAEDAASSAPVAQLDRVPASEAVGCGFDPRRVQFSKGLQGEGCSEGIACGGDAGAGSVWHMRQGIVWRCAVEDF